jgi:glycosyltransferase involved in cell wall biosynthesis
VNIAHLLPYAAQFPLRKHNGRYEWALRLARIQAQQGHIVTIYAGPSSHQDTPHLQWRSLTALSTDVIATNIALFKLAFTDQSHDIFHSHLDSLHYTLASETVKPVIFTQHWFPTPEIATIAKSDTVGKVLAVPVTKYMFDEDIHLGIRSAPVISHGIDLSLFKQRTVPRSNRLIFVGRVSPRKGVKEAVEIALATGSDLDLVGKINAKDSAYWDTILPSIDGEQIRYLGAKSREEVAILLAQAKAMLFLPQQPEAFGQTIIEAQACGTPVIVNNSGANNELLESGTTGYLVDESSEYRQAILDVSSLHANDCRRFAERFSQEKMVASYYQLYEQLIAP